MREIRFRAKAVSDGRWRTLTLNNSMLDVLKIESNYEDEDFLDMKTLGESTGKYDASGKEVFEGDVIENPHGIRMTICFGTYSGYCPADKCYMDSVGFYAEAPGFPQMPIGPLEEYAQVIGNIHDNPELMDKEDK